MVRAVVVLVLILVLARAFWQLMDGIIEGASGRVPPSGTRKSVAMSRDPVCGTFVVPERAVALVEGSQTVYFCSNSCRDKYRATHTGRPAGRTA